MIFLILSVLVAGGFLGGIVAHGCGARVSFWMWGALVAVSVLLPVLGLWHDPPSRPSEMPGLGLTILLVLFVWPFTVGALMGGAGILGLGWWRRRRGP